MKKSSLEDWENEEKKIMIIINILNIDMNISEIMIIIYLRKTFECISFLQKSKRREWENEMFKSIMIMNEMNYEWLQRMNFRLLISKDIILTKFLIIKDYRRNSLNRYKDESKYEIDYINLNAKSYDNYITTKNISRYQKKKLEFELKEEKKRVRIKLYKRWINEVRESI